VTIETTRGVFLFVMDPGGRKGVAFSIAADTSNGATPSSPASRISRPSSNPFRA
jgi:hypothetical protein